MKICVVLVVLLLILCGSQSVPAATAVSAEIVNVESGSLRGTVEDELRVYRGIPYAAPPIGDLRWRPPQPALKWEGVRAADQFGRACIQTNQAIANLPAPSEDCLYLNVWTPAKSAEHKLPVLFWIHGGGFVAGAPAEQLYHGEWLAKKGVVFVSVAYRLGVFGFLAHPELSAESAHHVSGNYGILDMIAGLQWVQKNIAAFGGDPSRSQYKENQQALPRSAFSARRRLPRDSSEVRSRKVAARSARCVPTPQSANPSRLPALRREPQTGFRLLASPTSRNCARFPLRNYRR